MRNACGHQCLGLTECYVMTGSNVLKTVGCESMTVHVQDVRQRQLTMFTMKSRVLTDVLTVREIAKDFNISVGSCLEVSVEKLM